MHTLEDLLQLHRTRIRRVLGQRSLTGRARNLPEALGPELQGAHDTVSGSRGEDLLAGREEFLQTIPRVGDDRRAARRRLE